MVIIKQVVAKCPQREYAGEVTTTSPSRRVERKERLRGESLAAASKMFADRGYEAVTLRAIAKEIGYTHAVIYQHFPDKAHILAELSSETIGLLIQNFDAIAAKYPEPKERLFATSRGLIQFCTAHPQQFRNVFFGPENRNGIRVGGATARHLLEQGKQVRARVRNREKAARWADQGVELVEGDWNDATAIVATLKGVEGAFVMLPSV